MAHPSPGGGKYAAGTTVPVGRTRDAIERTLTRYGATGFMFGQDQDTAAVAFLIRGRHVRFIVPMPQPDDARFTHTPTRQRRSEMAAVEKWQQAVRARWRALGLILQAKLEAVDAGVVELDTEFMAQLVMPDGRTVGETVRPQLDSAISAGAVPALLPGGAA
jgi:hypothetical protein